MPPVLIDLTGQQFGRWTVIARNANQWGGSAWRCQCDCGTEAIVNGAALRYGKSHSCGCLRREAQTIHGKSGTQEYEIWQNMNQRCLNSNHTSFHRYGGRGITICKRWRSFEKFLADIGPRPSPSHQLDRKNNMKGYFKGNCHWVTRSEQQNNRHNNRRVTLGNETLTLAQWAKRLNFPYQTLANRIKKGWPPELILSPLKYNRWTKPLATR